MNTKIFLLTFIFLSISFAKGQDYTYIPWVEEGTRWSYASVWQVGYFDYEAGYETYQLKGDTIISGLNYKKLLYGCSENYIAALREEDKKVFIREKEQEDERLMYDFNLQEGDWITYNIYDTYQVTKIDMIQIGETNRKRFWFGLYETWIEGIGALEDFYPMQGRLTDSSSQGINYQKKGSEIVYKTEEWYFNENECNSSDIRPPLSSMNYEIKIQEGNIHIRFFTNETVQISLNDISGRLYYHSSLSTTDVTIPSQSFPKGIYLLKTFNSDKNQASISKIILYP